MIPQHLDFLVRVSCITYNHAPYIVDAMNGFVMQQTSFPFVCTILDDASTDGEKEIIKSYLEKHFDLSDNSIAYDEETEDYNLTFTRHKTNHNCYFAVLYLKYNHYSIKKSKQPYISRWSDTKYVALCEGDDYWIDSLKLQKQLDFMESHLDYSMCWHDASRRDAVTNQEKGDFKRYEADTTCPTEDLIMGGDFCPTASLFYRKEIYEKAPDELFNQYVGDYPLQVYMALMGKVYFFNKMMSVYRVNVPGSWVNRSYDYSCKENREKIWPKEIKMYNDFNSFSHNKYSHAFKQQEYKYMFREMLKLSDFNSARKYWYKLDFDKRPWDWVLILNMHGRISLKMFFKRFWEGIRGHE